MSDIRQAAQAALAAEGVTGDLTTDEAGDPIDRLLLLAKDVIATSSSPKSCGLPYMVPQSEWLALQAEVMHRLRERAREYFKVTESR